MTKKVQCLPDPCPVPLYQVEDYIVVIIDIFRATSSICYGIDNGAEAIIPVAEVEECAAYRENETGLPAGRRTQRRGG